MASCTYNSHISTTVNPTSGQLDWLDAYNSYAFLGDSHSKSVTLRIEFTPSFTCASDKIKFSLIMSPNAATTILASYAISTSINDSRYFGAVGSFGSLASNELVAGNITVSLAENLGAGYYRAVFEIDTKGKLANGSPHYLYLWSQYIGQGLVTLQPKDGLPNGLAHTITLTEKAHAYTSKVTPPTCTTQGYTTYTCSNCGHSYTGNVTAATGHKYVGTVVAPTCTTQGYTSYKCSVCGDTSKANDTYTAALGHNYVETSRVEATYTSEGLITSTCSRCGVTKTEVIPKKDGGFIFIDNGSGWDAYMVYIDNGSGWDLYIPYIDDGSEWIILA